MNYDEVYSIVSSLPHAWTQKSSSITLASVNSIYRFLKKQFIISSNSQQNDKINPKQIPYHQSIFHFLLYYTYYPKVPFIIQSNNTIIFGSIYGKDYTNLEISYPFNNMVDDTNMLSNLLHNSVLSSLLEELSIKQVLLRDIPDESLKIVPSSQEKASVKQFSVKEINYQIYNVKRSLDMKGGQFANLRWHLNSFSKAKHSVKPVSLSEHSKAVIHLIGEWKKNAVKHRGFSFVNVRSDKHAIRLFSELTKTGSKSTDNNQPTVSDCFYRILKVDDQIRSFHLGYPLGIFTKKHVFAHTIGITDLSIPHLAEYAQYDFWKQIRNKGYKYVNDGPSWRSSLAVFKQKFRSIAKKRYYYLTISL